MNRRPWVIAAFSILAGAGGLRPADPVSVEARLLALEQQVRELATENKTLRAKLETGAERSPGLAVRPEGKETALSLGGLMQVQAESSGVPDARYAGLSNRVQLRRMRVALAGTFAEDICFKFETDFGNAAIAGKTGATGQITDAFIGWRKYPGLNVRAGQFKSPFGYEQLVPDPRTFFVERTLSNDRLTAGRQIGAQIFSDPAASRLGYALGVFNGSGANNGSNDNSNFMTAGRVTATLHTGTLGPWAFRWTAAGDFFHTVDKGTFSGRRTGTGFDTQVTWGAAQVGAEWLRNDNHPIVGAPVDAEGWYVFSTWSFNRRWQGVVRYEAFNSNLTLLNCTTREWTFGVNYLLKGDDLKLMLNYQSGQPAAPSARDGRLLGRMQVAF